MTIAIGVAVLSVAAMAAAGLIAGQRSFEHHEKHGEEKTEKTEKTEKSAEPAESSK